MKHGNNKQNMTAEQKTKQEAEKKTLEPELETEDLLKELKAVLEISEEEKTEKPEHTDSGSSQKEAKPEAAPAETPAEEKKPEKTAEAPNKSEPLSAVSYASMAHAVQEAKKEPTGRFSRDAVDDETLLAELHALIGDTEPSKPAQSRTSSPFAASRKSSVTPEPRPVARITPDALKNVPEDYEEVMEADTMGVPGWVKGIFILLISLLLGAMTFYAVASDVLGKVF